MAAGIRCKGEDERFCEVFLNVPITPLLVDRVIASAPNFKVMMVNREKRFAWSTSEGLDVCARRLVVRTNKCKRRKAKQNGCEPHG